MGLPPAPEGSQRVIAVHVHFGPYVAHPVFTRLLQHLRSAISAYDWDSDLRVTPARSAATTAPLSAPSHLPRRRLTS